MSDGQALALMMMKKRAEGSLDMPVKKKKKKKVKKEEEPILDLPPPSPTPPPTPPEPPPTPDNQLIVTVVPEENQFFDDECKEADEKLDKQKKKVKKVSSLMARLHASVQQIKERYNDLDIAELLSKKPNRDKVAQARAFVHSQVVKKKSFDKKMDQVKTKEENHKKIKEDTKIKVIAKEKEKQIAEQRKQFEEKKKQRQKSIKQALEKEEKAKAMVAKYGDKPLYIKMELCQEKKDKRKQKADEAFLKKRAEHYNPLDFKDFSHMKMFDEQIRDKAILNEQQQMEKHHQLMQQNLKLLEKIYRGKNYEMAQQEVEDRKELKSKIYQIRQRMKKYSKYVQENFRPEVPDEEEQKPDFQSQGHQGTEEDEQDLDEDEIRKRQEQKYPRYKQIKRYKFLQGKSCGQIIQKVKQPYSQRIQRRVGNDYMQQMKSLPKARNKKQKVQNITLLKPKIEMPQIPRPKHYSVLVSQTPNRKEIQNMMCLLKSKDSQRDMKQKHLLRMAGDSSKFQTQEAGKIHDDLIANLERKLSFLQQLD